MENQIYCFYNKLSQRYEGVFSFPTDAVCINRLTDEKNPLNQKEFEVCKIGSIRMDNGVVTSYPPKRLELPVVEKSVSEKSE